MGAAPLCRSRVRVLTFLAVSGLFPCATRSGAFTEKATHSQLAARTPAFRAALAPPILLVQRLNPRTVGIEYIAGTIGRTIVDNVDLKCRKGLVQCAGNRLINPVRVVVRGYDSGDRKR